MNDPKAAAAYHPGDAPVTRPDLHTLIRDVYARISYPRDIELGRLNWDDMGGGDPSDERVEWEIAFGDVTAALAAERARADQAADDLFEAEQRTLTQIARAGAAEARADQAEHRIADALSCLRASSVPLGMTEVMFQDRLITEARRVLSVAPTAEQ